MTVRTSVGSVEIVDVSLPVYAETDSVVLPGDDGLSENLSGVVWADTLERSLTSGLMRNLSAITGAQVAPEPWPLASQPDAEITVWVDEIRVTETTMVQMAGQFAVYQADAPRGGLVQRFDLTVPLPNTSNQALSQAYGTLWRLLAERVATAI